VAGGFSALYDVLSDLETLGICRRGYFVEGLGGAQFALPGAVERLRSFSRQETAEEPPKVLAATDPAQPFGAALRWPERPDGLRTPQRVAGAYVVIAGGDPLLYVERGGRGLQVLGAAGDQRLPAALEALAGFVKSDRKRRLAIERVDGTPVMGTAWEPLLGDAGFSTGPNRMTLRA
jgi:ATP-dependent Lhr-like helicase